MQAHWTHLTTLLIPALAILGHLGAASAAPPAGGKLARPTPELAAWQDLGLGSFITCDIPVFKRGWDHLHYESRPEPSGLIPESDMKRYRGFGDEIRRRFGKSIAESMAKDETVELALTQPTRIDHVITMESILEGERVREYVIEGFAGGPWEELMRGNSIGHMC